MFFRDNRSYVNHVFGSNFHFIFQKSTKPMMCLLGVKT